MLRNGYEWLPKDQRKRILLISDDLRMPSGVGTMSREFVLGTCHHFNWIQIGAAINHPDAGKRIDMGEAISNETGVVDAEVAIYPYNGYGDEDLIRYIIETDKPDAVMLYTDPRFFTHVFQMEHEIRQKMPIFYLAIWDDLPDPQWNAPFYASCDLIMSISKQSYAIHKRVLQRRGKGYAPSGTTVTYIPHGINEQEFYPIRTYNKEKEYSEKLADGSESKVLKKDSEILEHIKTQLFKDADVDFVVLYVNRNIRRKLPGDVVLAYSEFCSKLTPEQAKKVSLVMHTQPIDENGTDLPAVVKELCPYRVVFSASRLEPSLMNVLYNLSDVTINISSNEGFGLGTCESLMAGTPIVVNVTGGLQDQCGFGYIGDKYFDKDDYMIIKSLHDKDVWKDNSNLVHGDWAFPVWPSNRSLQGSPPTPYIFDDRPDYKEVADKLLEVYKLSEEDRNARGDNGREYVLNTDVGMSASEMSRRFMQDMDGAFDVWAPRRKYALYSN